MSELIGIGSLVSYRGSPVELGGGDMLTRGMVGRVAAVAPSTVDVIFLGHEDEIALDLLDLVALDDEMMPKPGDVVRLGSSGRLGVVLLATDLEYHVRSEHLGVGLWPRDGSGLMVDRSPEALLRARKLDLL